MREEITKADIADALIVGMHRNTPNPFAYTTLIYALPPSEEPQYSQHFTVRWNADGVTGRRLFILGLNQERQEGFDLDDISERRKRPHLYWLPEDVPAFVGARGFYVERDFRITLEQELRGDPIYQDPGIVVQKELYREEITIGVGSRLAIGLEIARWYGLLEKGTDRLLADYFRTNERRPETEQYVWFLENLIPFFDTRLIEEAYLRKILLGKCEIDGILPDIQAILGDKVRHFKSREHLKRVLASLQKEILAKE